MTGKRVELEELGAKDADVAAALGLFRESVHAWSEGEYGRTRAGIRQTGTVWRRSVAWAAGLVLTAGIAGGAVYEHHQRVEVARQVQVQREQERVRQLAADRALDAEDLMARVDSDVSRAVPSAMEPLARLMDESQ